MNTRRGRFPLDEKSRTRAASLGLAIAVLALLPLAACDTGGETPDKPGRPYPPVPFAIDSAIVERDGPLVNAPTTVPTNDRTAYFGDLHVHTSLSLDAFVFGTTMLPRDAYRYARGEAVDHPGGFPMQLRTPLDFYAVTDHALFLGLAREAGDTDTTFSKLDVADPLRDLNAPGADRSLLSVLPRLGLFSDWMGAVLNGLLDGSIDQSLVDEVTRSAWLDTIEAADAFYEPGRFTTFVAFEYTSGAADGGSLHRNVVFRGSDRVPVEPFSRYHSRDPRGLWNWLDGLRARGVEALAIPHNSNLSNGQMFTLTDWDGAPLDDATATQRLRNEPLVEITQVKGTSETHPELSDTDEWASFEIATEGANAATTTGIHGSYVRQALRDGLEFSEDGRTNPFQFGFIGSSDTHVGATNDSEETFHSKAGLLDATPELRGSVPLPWWMSTAFSWLAPKRVTEVGDRAYSQTPTRNFGASGLAGVWAEANTREAIYDAFRRKETFATSGPRIRIRFFAGADLDASMLANPSGLLAAYDQGIPMGGVLIPGDGSGATPRFLAQVTRDALGAPLQRLQIVKGWVENGATFERVFDIACSDGGVPHPETHRCPDNGARVDLGDCSYSQDVGAAQLSAVWEDPGFDPSQRVFYYARALENPTCRWSTWDALRHGSAPRPDLSATLQERAWSSPIWIRPGASAEQL